jgi:hypothetical protein
MELSNIIKCKFGEAVLTKMSVILQDDGQGAYIAKWDESLGDMPDQDTLNMWEQEVQMQYIQSQFEDAMSVVVNSKPEEKGYDNIATLCSYTTSKNPQWKAEADAFIEWRDDLFAYAYQILADVQEGKIEIPNEQEFLDNAPQLVWP